LTTAYIYDPGTGELKTVDYSDGTADISFAYDRLGRQKQITDAAGTRTFTYNNALQPSRVGKSEALPTGECLNRNFSLCFPSENPLNPCLQKGKTKDCVKQSFQKNSGGVPN